MVKDPAFVETLIRYHEVLAVHPERPWRIYGMMELAPGVVAILDQENEVDTFFDTKRWVFKDPELWRRSPGHTRPDFYPSAVEVLPGAGIYPHIVRSYRRGMWFAQTQIQAVDPATSAWNEAPVPVTIPDSIKISANPNVH